MSGKMNKDEIRLRREYLATRWKSGTATEEEEKELFDWLNQQEEIILHIPASFSESEELLKQKMLDQINLAILQQPSNKNRISRIRIWSAAAAILLFIGAGIFYLGWPDKTQRNGLVLLNDIPPGKNSATLTLSNGKKIVLSTVTKGELAKETGIRIAKTSEGQLSYEATEQSEPQAGFNTLSTGNGEQYEVVLPDQSRVRLNAASSIRYPVSFNGLPERKIELSGEAYFEVTKDSKHPFLVQTTQQTVKVLGTHFNVNAYPDEPLVKTILTEGSVSITQAPSSAGVSPATLLKPGEQAVLQSGKIKTGPADLESGMAWIKGDFVFDDESLESAMRRIARWYDVQVIYTAAIPSGVIIGGALSQSKPISAVLERIEKAAHVKFRVKGKKIYVSP
jgi:transmembrane sensor